MAPRYLLQSPDLPPSLLQEVSQRLWTPVHKPSRHAFRVAPGLALSLLHGQRQDAARSSSRESRPQGLLHVVAFEMQQDCVCENRVEWATEIAATHVEDASIVPRRPQTLNKCAGSIRALDRNATLLEVVSLKPRTGPKFENPTARNGIDHGVQQRFDGRRDRCREAAQIPPPRSHTRLGSRPSGAPPTHGIAG